MIEQLIEAERMLSVGLVDQAERLYRQVAEHDPKSSIAVVGLARVALERGDERTAYLEARRALAIDPDNPAAHHLVMRLAEVMEARGETPPEAEPEQAAAATVVDDVTSTAGALVSPPPTAAAAPPTAAAAPSPRRARKQRSLVDRLLGRRG
jgi:thioredoxin-like negative regulator of GroEL